MEMSSFITAQLYRECEDEVKFYHGNWFYSIMQNNEIHEMQQYVLRNQIISGKKEKHETMQLYIGLPCGNSKSHLYHINI